jgi:hypothetical protein
VSPLVALVAGADRPVALDLARTLRRRGAHPVYPAARDPLAITERGVTPVWLDPADPHSLRLAAKSCADVTVLVDCTAWSDPQRGAVPRAFGEVLAANGGAVLTTLPFPPHVVPRSQPAG